MRRVLFVHAWALRFFFVLNQFVRFAALRINSHTREIRSVFVFLARVKLVIRRRFEHCTTLKKKGKTERNMRANNIG